MLDLCTVVAVGEAGFRRALSLGMTDFEDAVQVAAALQVDADYIVTRNDRDFRASSVSAKLPATMAALLATAR